MSGLFLIIGMLFILIGTIGIITLPDVLCRAHAVSMALVLGISLMLLGLWVHLGTEAAGLKILLAISFQFGTTPVAGHLFGFYAYKKMRHLLKGEN